MDILIALSPDLDISAAGFVAAWNADPAALDMAGAEVGATGAKSFDPTVGAIMLSAAGSIALGVLSNFLTDWIKARWAERHPDPSERARVQVTQVPQPNGPPILVVTISHD